MSKQRLYWLPWWWYQWPRGWAFLPRDRVKTPAKISPLKGRKFSFISIMTTKVYLHIIEETCIAQNHTFISKFLQVLLRYSTKTWKSGVFTPVYPILCKKEIFSAERKKMLCTSQSKWKKLIKVWTMLPYIISCWKMEICKIYQSRPKYVLYCRFIPLKK